MCCIIGRCRILPSWIFERLLSKSKDTHIAEKGKYVLLLHSPGVGGHVEGSYRPLFIDRKTHRTHPYLSTRTLRTKLICTQLSHQKTPQMHIKADLETATFLITIQPTEGDMMYFWCTKPDFLTKCTFCPIANSKKRKLNSICLWKKKQKKQMFGLRKNHCMGVINSWKPKTPLQKRDHSTPPTVACLVQQHPALSWKPHKSC